MNDKNLARVVCDGAFVDVFVGDVHIREFSGESDSGFKNAKRTVEKLNAAGEDWAEERIEPYKLALSKIAALESPHTSDGTAQRIAREALG